MTRHTVEGPSIKYRQPPDNPTIKRLLLKLIAPKTKNEFEIELIAMMQESLDTSLAELKYFNFSTLSKLFEDTLVALQAFKRTYHQLHELTEGNASARPNVRKSKLGGPSIHGCFERVIPQLVRELLADANSQLIHDRYDTVDNLIEAYVTVTSALQQQFLPIRSSLEFMQKYNRENSFKHRNEQQRTSTTMVTTTPKVHFMQNDRQHSFAGGPSFSAYDQLQMDQLLYENMQDAENESSISEEEPSLVFDDEVLPQSPPIADTTRVNEGTVLREISRINALRFDETTRPPSFQSRNNIATSPNIGVDPKSTPTVREKSPCFKFMMMQRCDNKDHDHLQQYSHDVDVCLAYNAKQAEQLMKIKKVQPRSPT